MGHLADRPGSRITSESCCIVCSRDTAKFIRYLIALLGTVVFVLALARRHTLTAIATVAGLGFALYLTHIDRDVLLV